LGEIVNLRRARNEKARAQKTTQAETNRVQHGTPKAMRALQKKRSEKETREHEGHKKD